MNGSDPRLDAPADPAFEELRSDLYSLQTMLSLSLVFLIVLAVTVDRFLWKQVLINRQQIESIQKLKDADHFDFARASAFWNSLVGFSKTHPDFVPVVNFWSQALSQTKINSPPPPKK